MLPLPLPLPLPLATSSRSSGCGSGTTHSLPHYLITFTFTVAMTSSYTPKATDSPKIRMSFDVANTLVATTSGTTCIMYIDPPVQAVSIYN